VAAGRGRFCGEKCAAERADPGSLLNWYTSLVALKRTNLTLHAGATTFIDRDREDVLVWVRRLPGKVPIIVLCNMSAYAAHIDLARDLKTVGIGANSVSILLRSGPDDSPTERAKILLAPFETLIAEPVAYPLRRSPR
jgi:hypothetical protein